MPAGWGAYATLVAFGVAVSITGYYATDQQEEATNRERSTQAARTASAMQMRNEKAAQAQPPMAAAGAAEGFSWDEVIAQIEWTLPQSPQVQSAGAPPGRKSLPDARSAGDRALRPIETRSPDPVPWPAPMLADDTAAVSGAAPAPEAPATPNADRRQVMAAALSRCERENFLAGFFCKERAWLQFCDGQWGEVPQCPSGLRNNNVR